MPSAYRDAAVYDRISGPLEQIGREVLERLKLNGTETVLDAGCGSGRVTQALLERLAHGHVIGLDGSAQMLAGARKRLGERVQLIQQDLEQLDLGAQVVDAVFSTATFHWVEDHSHLFGRLRAVLREGGQLVAQCGGVGNTPQLLQAARSVGSRPPFDRYLGEWDGPWTFATPAQTAVRLRAAGFTDIRTWLVARPAPYEDLREWLQANALTAHTARLPEELQEPFLEAVARRLGPNPTITYIRLNLDAVAG